MATEIKDEEVLSVARACKKVSVVRCMYYYKSVREASAVDAKLTWYSEKYPSRGFLSTSSAYDRKDGDGTIKE